MKKIYLWLLALFTCWQVSAQVSMYSFSQSNGTYTALSGSTTLSGSESADSYASALTDIGFTFVLNGVGYTQFSATSNGFVKLGTIANAYTSTPISSNGSGPAIAFFARDGKTSASGITYLLSGTAPSRVLTIEYTDYMPYWNSSTILMNCQVKLYETTNVIEMVYGSSTGGTTSYNGQVGIVGSATSDYNNRTTTTDWAATTAGIVNTASVTFKDTVYPASGLTFSWVLPSCLAPTGLVASNVTSSSATISWTASSSAPANGYEYYFSTSNTSPTTTTVPSGSVGAGVTTANISSLSADTTYYFWVRSVCSGSDTSPWSMVKSFITGYCIPSSTSSSTYINNFSTTGGTTNVSNLASGYTTGGYQDNYNSQTVSFYQGSTVNFVMDIVGGSLGAAIWIDWNDNLTFDSSERVYVTSSYGYGPFSGTISIPTTATVGSHRMRVMVDYNSSTPSNPCMTTSTRTETEDYKFTVLAMPTDAVDWANLQSILLGTSPVTSIQTCQTARVYSQVYEPGVTEDDVADSGLQVWIGKSTTDTDPSTWPASAWTLASVNTGFDVGSNSENNDEYYVDFSGLTAGNYYFASKYILNNGPVKYGAYASTGGGFWDGTTNVNKALAVLDIPSVSVTSSSAEICSGFSTTLTASSSNANFTYSWDNGAGSGDTVTVSPVTTTLYTVTATDSVSGCTTTATVNVIVNPLPTSVSVSANPSPICLGNISTLTATGFEATVSGKIGTGSATNTSSTPYKAYYGSQKTQAIYTAAELTALGLVSGSKITSIGHIALSGTPLQMNNFTLNVGLVSTSALNTTSFDTGATTNVFTNAAYLPTSGTGNIDYTLATPLVWDGTSNLLVETCFNNANSGGTISNSISVESSTVASGLFVYQNQDSTDDACSVIYTISNSTNRPNLRMSYVVNNSVTWSPITGLYTDASATTAYVADTNATTVYAKPTTSGTTTYTVKTTNTNDCSVTTTVDLLVNDIPVTPTGATIQEFCTSDGATLAAFVVTATGTLTWYDAVTAGNVLPATTVPTNGSTYYVSQTVNGCESERLAITAAENCPGCLNDPNGQWPTSIYTPTVCNGVTSNIITSAGFAGEYSKVNVVSGETYQFNSSIETDFITISDEEATTVLTSGTQSVTWVSTITGVIRFYTHVDSECGDNTDFRTRSIICGSPPTTAPDCPTLVSPSDLATDISLGLLLTWAAPTTGSSVSSYDVYLEAGNADPSVLLGNQTGLTRNVTGLLPSTTYYWKVIAKNAAGDSTGCSIFSFTTATAPSNDDCSNAINLTVGTVFETNPVNGTLLAATNTTGVTPSCQPTVNSDVWYTVTVPDSGNVTIEVQQSSTATIVDGVLAVYSGTCGSLTQVGCDDDSNVDPSGLMPILTLTGQTPGTVLYVGFWKYGTIYPSVNNTQFVISAYDSTAGVDDIIANNSTLIIYPNPVKDVLYIKSVKEIANTQIFSLNGSLVSETRIAVENAVNVGSLQNGNYIIKINFADGSSETKQFIKK